MATRVAERFVVTDCEDHGSRRPLVKMTCEVTSGSPLAPSAMPAHVGIHAGRGVTPKRLRHSEVRPERLHGCGGNMSVTLLAAIGWMISVHAR